MGIHRAPAETAENSPRSRRTGRLGLAAAAAALSLCLLVAGGATAPAGADGATAASQKQRAQANKRAMLKRQVRRCRKIGARARRAQCLTQVKTRRCRLTRRGKQMRLCIRRVNAANRDGSKHGANRDHSQQPDGLRPGTYRGKVGTFARIVFTVGADGTLITDLNAGVKTNCLRSSDAFLTETKVVSTAPQEQDPAAELKVSKGRFSGSGQDENGVSWEIEGSVGTDGKAAGKFEASLFESVYNPFVYGGFDGQLCSGSGDWTAQLSHD